MSEELFADWLERVLAEKHWTLERLRKAMGRKKAGYLSDLRSGKKTNPSKEYVEQIMKAIFSSESEAGKMAPKSSPERISYLNAEIASAERAPTILDISVLSTKLIGLALEECAADLAHAEPDREALLLQAIRALKSELKRRATL